MKKRSEYSRTYVIYKVIEIFIMILYVATALKIWTGSRAYLKYALGIFHIIMALLLLYLFNPFRTVECTDIHRSIGFSAGIIILLGTSLMQYFYSTEVSKEINSKVTQSQDYISLGIKEYV